MDREKKDDNDFPTTTSLWSDEIEKVLSDIGESCQNYKILCSNASQQDTLKYDFLMYTLLAIGPVTGSLSAFSVSKPQHTDELQIVITIFSMLGAIFSAIIKFSKFDQRATLYKTMASKYASLEGNIRRQMSLARKERVNAGKYLEWISTSYDELFASTPILHEDITKENIVIATNKSVTNPQERTDTFKVEIKENRYDDAMMRYEMLRLKGFSDPKEKV